MGGKLAAVIRPPPLSIQLYVSVLMCYNPMVIRILLYFTVMLMLLKIFGRIPFTIHGAQIPPPPYLFVFMLILGYIKLG